VFFKNARIVPFSTLREHSAARRLPFEIKKGDFNRSQRVLSNAASNVGIDSQSSRRQPFEYFIFRGEFSPKKGLSNQHNPVTRRTARYFCRVIIDSQPAPDGTKKAFGEPAQYDVFATGVSILFDDVFFFPMSTHACSPCAEFAHFNVVVSRPVLG